MLDRHAVQALARAGVTQKEIAVQFGTTARTVRRIIREGAVATSDDKVARSARGVGRPGVDQAVRDLVGDLVKESPWLPPGEVRRRLREGGVKVGLSTVYRLITQVRGSMPAELMVRFEGVAGEFGQFDFGEVWVRLVGGGRKKIHFAAYRLKYSRWIHVVIVPNQKVEALVRSLLECFLHSGPGVPLAVVFDNPRTVVIRREEGRPVWHHTLAQAVIDFGFAIELCTPRAPQQKGSVENLVGYVKRAFFRARTFLDIGVDLPTQLTVWLAEVNTERPSRATKEIPLARLTAEVARMKPLAIAPEGYGLTFPVTVGPTAMVTFQGVRYAMPAAACGIAATLYLYPDRVRIVTAGGKHEVFHPRFPTVGSVSYQPGQRASQLAAVAGARKRLYFMRERILELGPVGEGYLTELIHQRPRTWKGDVERLFALLEETGEERFRSLLNRALFERLIGAEYMVRLASASERGQEVAS
jgi:transposase